MCQEELPFEQAIHTEISREEATDSFELSYLVALAPIDSSLPKTLPDDLRTFQTCWLL